MQVASGQFLAHVRYDARAGKMFKMDKRVDGGSDAVELPPGTRFAVDLGTFEAGYVAFTAQGPVRHMVPYTTDTALPPRPADLDQEGKPMFRPGFWTKICGTAVDGAREWCSNAAVLLGAMDDFWTTATASAEAAAGQIPLIAITGTVPVKSGSGARTSTNYAPVIQIVGYVDRPEALLGPRTVPLPQSAMTAQAGAARAAAERAAAAFAPAPVTPMPAQPVKRPVMADSEMPF
jgi:hypothetical protein